MGEGGTGAPSRRRCLVGRLFLPCCLMLRVSGYQAREVGRWVESVAALSSLVLPCRVAVEVVTTMTSADVMWQDGSVECNVRSNDLFPVHHLDNNEFCPGDFVVDKRGSAGWGLGRRGERSGHQGHSPWMVAHSSEDSGSLSGLH